MVVMHLLFKVINVLFGSIPDFNLAEIQDFSSVVTSFIILVRNILVWKKSNLQTLCCNVNLV